MKRRTKIVATLGPATDKPDILEGIIRAGVNVVRLNFSHGTHEDHIKRVNAVREISNWASRLGFYQIFKDLKFASKNLRMDALHCAKVRHLSWMVSIRMIKALWNEWALPIRNW